MSHNMADSIQGLTDKQAAERLAKGMSNNVAFKTGRTYLGIVRKNAFTFINSVLFPISILLALMGQAGDALVTGGLVLFNVLVGVTQEARAKRRLDQLALQVQAKERLIRGGSKDSSR